jgi:hypothetical protein
VAKDFLADAVARNLTTPQTIHADRGGSMTSKPVSEPGPRQSRGEWVLSCGDTRLRMRVRARS